MQPQAYLHVVRTSAGWAVCCQRCGATIAITPSRRAADRQGTDHSCAPSVPEEAR
jgi:hypothetical protein